MTNQDRITLIGIALYGPLWQRAVARALQTDPRQVQRWVSGQYPCPDWAIEQLIKHAEGHANNVIKALNICDEFTDEPIDEKARRLTHQYYNPT